MTEDDAVNNTATGTVAVTDDDTGEGTLSSSTAKYGTVEVVDGNWTYTLDNSDATVQALADGVTMTDTITFTSDDDTTQTQTVTITGANEVTAGQTFTINGHITNKQITTVEILVGGNAVKTSDSNDEITFQDGKGLQGNEGSALNTAGGDDKVFNLGFVEANSTIDMGVGNDTLEITGDNRGIANIAGSIDMGANDDTLEIKGSIAGSGTIQGGSGTDKLILGSYASTDWVGIKDQISGFETVTFGTGTNAKTYYIITDSNGDTSLSEDPPSNAPITIDLDGDGIEYLGLDAGVTFADWLG